MLRQQHVALYFFKGRKGKELPTLEKSIPSRSTWKQDLKIIAWQQKCPWIFLTYNKCRNWAKRFDCLLKQLINTNQWISIQRRMGYDNPRRLFNIMSKATNIKRLQFTPVSRCWKSFWWLIGSCYFWHWKAGLATRIYLMGWSIIWSSKGQNYG